MTSGRRSGRRSEIVGRAAQDAQNATGAIDADLNPNPPPRIDNVAIAFAIASHMPVSWPSVPTGLVAIS